MRGGTRGGLMPYTPPHETLATTSSRPNSKALVGHVLLAHPRVSFHPYTCGHRRGTVVVAAALIGYDDITFATKTTTWRRRSWSTTSATLMHDNIGSLLQLSFSCSACLVVTIRDLFLTSILGWHSRCSASVAYPFPTNSPRVAEFLLIQVASQSLLVFQQL
jgi:hypothetical protein